MDLETEIARLEALPPTPEGNVEIAGRREQLAQLQRANEDDQARLGSESDGTGVKGNALMAKRTYDTLASSLQSLRASIDVQQQEAADKNEAAIAAQAEEDRARENQFRLEVAAAHEDPDTYAGAKKDSVDAVAQCSVSVIGEGLLQVRGPMKGIDKIRTMVHQIDMPVGQIKVEIVTVQLNGENGNRMEKPLGRAEAHLGLGRFLTSQSLMMLRQAIVAEASVIASEADQGGHYQVDRDRKYLYAFFGRDFIDELYEMDSEFLRSENKLLSLHSMDTVSLQQALFILALAKNDVRSRILAQFMASVRSELVRAEFDYRRSAEIYPYKTHKWLPHHEVPHKDDNVLYRVCLNNANRYHFRNLMTFFGATQIQESDVINPLQREFIRLAQIFKSRLISELELKQRVIERAMIEDARELDVLEEERAVNAIRPRLIAVTSELQDLKFKASDQLADIIPQSSSIFRKYLAQLRDSEENAKKIDELKQSISQLQTQLAGDEGLLRALDESYFLRKAIKTR